MNMAGRVPGFPPHFGLPVAGGEPPKDEKLKLYSSEYNILIEYRHLRTMIPSGIYVAPSLDSMHEWHGVIFPRQSLFRKGIFKFTIEIPTTYPKALPHVEFSSRVFHPRVSPAGELDLVKLIPPSSLGKPCLALTLKAIQHIFYSHEPGADPANPDAAQMVTEDAEGFKEEAARCVEASLSEVYETPPGSLLRFGEYTEAHDAMRLSLLEAMVSGRTRRGGRPW
eukprot:jgi/Mesvir1/8802/Mv02705-RA.2